MAMNTSTETVFEQSKKIDNLGNEYWSATDLAKILEYSEYRHFLPVVERAKEACVNSGYEVSDHFEDVLEMVLLGKTAQREVSSVKLSRYASYLIVQNADPSRTLSPKDKLILLCRHVFKKSVRWLNTPICKRKMSADYF